MVNTSPIRGRVLVAATLFLLFFGFILTLWIALLEVCANLAPYKQFAWVLPGLFAASGVFLAIVLALPKSKSGDSNFGHDR